MDGLHLIRHSESRISELESKYEEIIQNAIHRWRDEKSQIEEISELNENI